MNITRTSNPGFLAVTMVLGALAALAPACGSDTTDSGPDSSNIGASSSTGGSSAGINGSGGSGSPAGTGGSGALQVTGGSASTAGGTSVTNVGTGGTAIITSTGGSSSICSSNTTWRSGENQNMRPGEACISCHSISRGAPAFIVAGTVYPTANESDDCNGSNSNGSAQVIITDANGVDHSISVNSSGNFMLEGASIPLPYKAKVQVGTATRSMSASQTSGDCNSCHTATGANSAPGRIMLP